MTYTKKFLENWVLHRAPFLHLLGILQLSSWVVASEITSKLEVLNLKEYCQFVYQILVIMTMGDTLESRRLIWYKCLYAPKDKHTLEDRIQIINVVNLLLSEYIKKVTDKASPSELQALLDTLKE